eukprot:NODE_141_length_15967_cov_0.946118.p1 type:complete len:840 gc:universal NODE_141_length_15967_cov_0.946118:8113-5594(-)
MANSSVITTICLLLFLTINRPYFKILILLISIQESFLKHSKMSKKNDQSFSLPDKSYLLQNAKIFHQQVNSRKCRLLIAKCLLYINNSGKNAYYELTQDEQTQLFFAASKLFNCKEYQLRQIVYILMMELTNAKDTIIMTNLLTKDIASTHEELFGKQQNTISLSTKLEDGPRDQHLLHTSNALKTLSKLIDPSLLQAFERFYTTCLVDKQPITASSAICSAYTMYSFNKDIVKKWSNLIQDQVGGYDFTSYHALATLYLLKKQDSMAIIKLCLQYHKAVNSPWALCVLLKMSKSCLLSEYNNQAPGEWLNGPLLQIFEFITKALSSKYEMVSLEACKCISDIALYKTSKGVGMVLTTQQVYPCVTQLSILLSSSKVALKFAALRYFNKLSMFYPTLVSNYNIDMENMITDNNRSIATYAITTLLKTGTEQSVDRLMKQIQLFLNDITEEFKIIVVEAVRSLSIKFPKKYPTLLAFLANVLRDEGNFQYKKSIVDAIFDLLRNIPECKSTALQHLCEFIEDCEYTTLSVRILHVLGIEGPSSDNPQQYIRYIYNRIILESSNVRAAAVHALAMFGAKSPKILNRILNLLEKCISDQDNEVRDRALFYIHVLKRKDWMQKYIIDDLVVNIEQLSAYLTAYKSGPLDLQDISYTSKVEAVEQVTAKPTLQNEPTIVQSPEIAPAEPVNHQDIFSNIPQLAPLSQFYFSTSAPILLTEQETEYVVKLFIHMFKNDAIVFQFEITNTLQDVLIENAQVQLNPTEDISNSLKLKVVVPCTVNYSGPNSTFIAYQKAPNTIPLPTFNAALKMTVKDCDPETFEPDSEQGYEETYNVIFNNLVGAS